MGALRLVVGCLVVGLVLAATGCGGGDTGTVALSLLDAGAVVDLATGDLLELELEANPSTGFRWEAVSVPAALVPRGDRFVALDDATVGAPGVQVLAFEAVGPGAGILRLEYLRPFEERPVPERVVEYVIRVDGAAWPPDDPGPTPTTSTAAVLDVADLAASAAGPVVVRGFVVREGDDARLCEVLLESYPPQCGGASVPVTDADALDVALEEVGGVRWTQDAVVVAGEWDGEGMRVTG